MLGGNDSGAMLTPGSSSGFHPALGEVRDLFDSGVLAVAANVGDSTDGPDGPRRRVDPALAYLPQGYFTLGWAAALAGSGAKNTAFTQFRNVSGGASRANMSLLVPGISGSQLARSVADGGSRNTLRTSFPATSLGRQLQQVAGILASGLTGGVYVCPMAEPAASIDPAARLTQRLRELSSALGAFHAATLSLGLDNSVTTFTAGEFHRFRVRGNTPLAMASSAGYELALGGAVAGGAIYGAGDAMSPGASRERYLATVAHWFGMPRTELKQHFPSLDATAAPTLDFLF